MSDRLAEIEKIPIPEYVHIDAKVVFKPHQDLNLLDFSQSLRMSNMPLSTKLKAITNSLFPTAHILGKDLSQNEKSKVSPKNRKQMPSSPILVPTMTE